MNKTTCSAIQRKLDESLLDDGLGSEISTHLAGCPDCSDFHLKETRLRQLVGSLGTVPAPADFDFRLRARLANEDSRADFQFWSLRYRTVAAALVVALIVGVSFVVFQMTGSNGTSVNVSDGNPPKIIPAPQIAPQINPQVNQVTKQKEQTTTGSVVAKGYQSRSGFEKRGLPTNTRTKKALAVTELSSEGAQSVRDSESEPSSEAVFPVDASQRSLKMSLFDSRGNPKTISLPSVSFGSQRVVPTATSYAQKGVW
jgi:hypothetical protein